MLESGNLIIVDLGTGNLNSVYRALKSLDMTAQVSGLAEAVERADKIILPGVGHFGHAMSELRSRGLFDALNEVVLIKRRPILGICLGMELMAKHSEEGDADGLGWVDARAVKFRFDDKRYYKAPHMGWNTVSIKRDSRLLKSIDENDEFYFAHAYHLIAGENGVISGETVYEKAFPSVIERDSIFGVQFHPEKSHAAGQKVLLNFIAL